MGQPAARSTGDVAADVCVVGLGGSGLAAVGAALEAGATVVGIDAGPIAGGAAGRNGGFLLAGGALFHHAAVAAWGEERAVGIYEESLRRARPAGGGARARSCGASARCGSRRRRRRSRTARGSSRRSSAHGLPGPSGRRPDRRRRVHPRRRLGPAARALPAARRARAGGAARGCYCDTPAVELAGTRVGTPGRRRRLQGGRGVRRRLDRAAAARAGRPGALLAPADARDRAGRARAGSPARSTTTGATSTGSSCPTAASRSAADAASYGDGEWGRAGGAGRRRAGAARPAAARARRRRRARHAPLGRRDRVHARPAAGVRRGAPRRDRRRRALRATATCSAPPRAARRSAIALGEPAPRLARLLRPEHWD